MAQPEPGFEDEFSVPVDPLPLPDEPEELEPLDLPEPPPEDEPEELAEVEEPVTLGGADDKEGEYDEAIEELAEELEELRGQIAQPNILDPVFFAQLGTDGNYREVIVGAGTDNTLSTGSPRNFTASSMITTPANTVAVVEVETPDTVKYVVVGNGVSIGSITGHTGTGSTYWVYQVTLPDNSTANAYNLCEWNGTNSGIIAGSPGSLGINVDASGTLTGGSCVIKPIGSKPVLLAWDYRLSRWCFDCPNSAQ